MKAKKDEDASALISAIDLIVPLYIKNKQRWTGHLMGKAMREIPEEDYELIMSVAK